MLVFYFLFFIHYLKPVIILSFDSSVIFFFLFHEFSQNKSLLPFSNPGPKAMINSILNTNDCVFSCVFQEAARWGGRIAPCTVWSVCLLSLWLCDISTQLSPALSLSLSLSPNNLMILWWSPLVEVNVQVANFSPQAWTTELQNKREKLLCGD